MQAGISLYACNYLDLPPRQTKMPCQQPTKTGGTLGFSQLATKSLSQGLTAPATGTPAHVFSHPITRGMP